MAKFKSREPELISGGARITRSIVFHFDPAVGGMQATCSVLIDGPGIAARINRKQRTPESGQPPNGSPASANHTA